MEPEDLAVIGHTGDLLVDIYARNLTHIYILPQCSTTAARVLNPAGMDAQFERLRCAISRGILKDGVIELRMTNINDAQCAISVKNGTAAASANVGGKRGAEKCKIVLKIQEQQGSRWVTLDSWTVEEDGRNASINGSVDAKSGKTYRAQATVTVWLDGKAESKTITTTGKTA